MCVEKIATFETDLVYVGICYEFWNVRLFYFAHELAMQPLPCEAKPTTLKRPSPGEGLRITCLVLTIEEHKV